MMPAAFRLNGMDGCTAPMMTCPKATCPRPRIWEADYTPNATGTAQAYYPQGALERGGQRARAVGDYEAWTPGGTDS